MVLGGLGCSLVWPERLPCGIQSIAVATWVSPVFMLIYIYKLYIYWLHMGQIASHVKSLSCGGILSHKSAEFDSDYL